MIEIDGAFGEGGGQILRTSLTLSAITKKPFKISNIRINRAVPGLQPQHVMAVLSTQKVCGAEIQGAVQHSQDLVFEPGKTLGGNYSFDIGTAGSAILVLQTLLPILLFADKKSRVTVIGGTHLPKSPNFDYFAQVFLPAIHRFSASATVSLTRSGYYPRGGGEVVLSVNPSSFKGCKKWDVQDTTHAIIRLGKLPSHIADRERKVLQESGIEKIEIHEEQTLSFGNAITIWQGFKGASTLGERGKRAEVVAAEVYEDFIKEQGPIDFHLADQLLLYAALAEGESQYSTSHFTDHLKTHVYVIAKFLEREIILEKNNIIIK